MGGKGPEGDPLRTPLSLVHCQEPIPARPGHWIWGRGRSATQTAHLSVSTPRALDRMGKPTGMSLNLMMSPAECVPFCSCSCSSAKWLALDFFGQIYPEGLPCSETEDMEKALFLHQTVLSLRIFFKHPADLVFLKLKPTYSPCPRGMCVGWHSLHSQ